MEDKCTRKLVFLSEHISAAADIKVGILDLPGNGIQLQYEKDLVKKKNATSYSLKGPIQHFHDHAQ